MKKEEFSNYMRLSTAAREIGVTSSAIKKHVKSGRLDFIEIDGVIFVERSALLYLDAQTCQLREKRKAKSKPGRKPKNLYNVPQNREL